MLPGLVRSPVRSSPGSGNAFFLFLADLMRRLRWLDGEELRRAEMCDQRRKAITMWPIRIGDRVVHMTMEDAGDAGGEWAFPAPPETPPDMI